jgi:hypothetical protein
MAMSDPSVELAEIPVLRLKADLAGAGPSAAFAVLESKLPTLKGRKFYGTFRFTPSGPEYHACVARVDTDDPATMGLETGVIAGGWYARRKLTDWKSKLPEFPKLFMEMGGRPDVDPGRPSVEFYRSQTEVLLLMPIRGASPGPPPETSD